QLFERFLAHVDARLVLAPLQQVEREIRELVAGELGGRRGWRSIRRRFGPLGHLPEQCSEAATHDRFLLAHGRDDKRCWDGGQAPIYGRKLEPVPASSAD